MNLLPSNVAELDALPPVDSRGLARHAFPDENAPPGTGLIRIAGLYLAAPDAKKAPCHICGKSQPVALTKAAPIKGAPYAICPEREQDECLARALIRVRSARAAAEAAAAAKEQQAAEEAAGPKPAPQPASKPRTRAQRVTQAAQAKTTEPPKEDGDAAG